MLTLSRSTRTSNKRGSILLAVIVMVVIIAIGVAMVLNRNHSKENVQRKNEVVTNLLEADKAMRAYLDAQYENQATASLLAGTASQLPATATQQTIANNAQSTIQQRYKARGGWNMVVPTITLPTGVNANYANQLGVASQVPAGVTQASDPFRFSTGTGVIQDTGTYQITLGPGNTINNVGDNVSSREVDPNNFAWVAANPETVPVSVDTWGPGTVTIEPPAYMENTSQINTVAEQEEVESWRSGGVYINSQLTSNNLLTNPNAISGAFNFVGGKNIVMKEANINRSSTTSNVATVTNMALALNDADAQAMAGGSGSVGTDMENSSLIRKVYGQSDFPGSLFLMGESGSTTEGPISNFWSATASGTYSGASSRPAFTPADADNIIVELVWKGGTPDQGGRPGIDRIYSNDLTIQNMLNAWPTGPGQIPGQDSDTYRVNTVQSNIAAYYNAAVLANPGTVPGLGESVPQQQPINVTVYESYFGGAIRVQSNSLFGDVYSIYDGVQTPAVAVDASLMAPFAGTPDGTLQDNPGHFPTDPNSTKMGVFVDVIPPSADPNDSVAVATALSEYSLMLNEAMVLSGAQVGSGVTERVERYADSSSSTLLGDDYTMMLPDMAHQYVFATNGRVTFDDYANVNVGTFLNSTGAILGGPNSQQMGIAGLSSPVSAGGSPGPLAPYLGGRSAGATPRAQTTIYASKLRPGFAFMDASSGLDTTLGIARQTALDPTISAYSFITQYAYHPNSASFPVVFAETAMTPSAFNGAAAYNIMASGIGSTGQVVPANLGISDMPGVTGPGVLSAPLGSEATITNTLNTWARSAVLQLTLIPQIFIGTTQYTNPLYSPALYLRLSEGGSIISSATGVPPGLDLADDLYNNLIINDARDEAAAYVRAYYQRYGWDITNISDIYTANATYNYRLAFSGNIKSDIYRYCLINLDGGGQQMGAVPFDMDQYVMLSGQSGVPYRYNTCPSADIITISAQSTVDPIGQDISSYRAAEVPQLVMAFFSPETDPTQEVDSGTPPVANVLQTFLSGANAEMTVGQVVTAINTPNQTGGAGALNPLTNQSQYTSDFTNLTTAVYYGGSNLGAASTSLYQSLSTQLSNEVSALMESSGLTQTGFASNGTVVGSPLDLSGTQGVSFQAWSNFTAAGAWTPFFGRVEYIVVASIDQANTASVPNGVAIPLAENTTGAYPHTYQVHASWSLDPTGLDPATPGFSRIRLYSVRVEQYPGVAFNYSNYNTGQGIQAPALDVGYMQSTYPSILNDSTYGLLPTMDQDSWSQLTRLMSGGTLTAGDSATIGGTSVGSLSEAMFESLILQSNCLPVTTQDLTNSALPQGGISGYRVFEPAPFSSGNSIDGYPDFSWTLYQDNGVQGHLAIQGTNGQGVPANLTSILNANIQTGQFTISPASNSVASDPTYTVNVTGPALTPIRNNIIIRRERTISGTRFEPLAGAALIAAMSGEANLLIDTSTGTNVRLLSNELADAVYNRLVKFKLYANFDGVYQDPLKANPTDLVGVGTLITGASSPLPVYLGDNTLIISTTDPTQNGNFAWHGNIITGVGTTWENSTNPQTLTLPTSSGSSTVPDSSVGIASNTIIFGDPMLTANDWGRVGYVNAQTSSSSSSPATRLQMSGALTTTAGQGP